MSNRSESDPPGAADLAEGLALHLRRWALQRGADIESANAAADVGRRLSLALAEGHVCLPLAECGADEGLRRRLLASGVVGTPDAPLALPLIVDAADRLYLHRQFDDERRLAERLTRACARPLFEAGSATSATLRALFATGESTEIDWQQIAVALAQQRRLVLVSGGPGTGKTTTVAHLLACLLREQPQLRIALAAPTGKAAARLADALRARAAHLPEALRVLLPTQASTVHRLLGALPGGSFAYDRERRLPIDLLVVDEASMLDLALARRLLEAVPDDARVVLLGDKDQLAAVEAGAVFAEASAHPTLTPACRARLADLCGIDAAAIEPPLARASGALPDSTVWLTRNYRFAVDSGIGALAEAVRRGDPQAALDRLGDPGDASVAWFDDSGPGPDAATWRHIVDGYAPYLQAVQRDPQDVAGIAAAFERFRVLCALRDGARGASALNQRLSEHARERLASLHASLPGGAGEWYVGRPVMVLRNDPLLQVFNGDIGFVLPAGEGAPVVHFPAADGRWRAVAPQRLLEAETAFAATVHKAQGSEFDALLLMLPAQPSRVLSRELLYTAVTRARHRVAIAGSAALIAQAVRSPTLRHSGLHDRLREAARDAGRSAP